MKTIKWYRYNHPIEENNTNSFSNIQTLQFKPPQQNRNNLVFDPNCPFIFYTAITDAPVDIATKELVLSVDGVEVLNIVSKYRFVIAIAPTFEESIVLKHIEQKLLHKTETKKVNNVTDLTPEEISLIDEFSAQIKANRHNLNESDMWCAGYAKNPLEFFFFTCKTNHTQIKSNFNRFLNTQQELYNLNIVDQS